MGKANRVEAEIDKILDRHTVATIQSANISEDGLPECNDAEFRRQILSMLEEKHIMRVIDVGNTGAYLLMSIEFYQALKNARSDGDESENRV